MNRRLSEPTIFRNPRPCRNFLRIAVGLRLPARPSRRPRRPTIGPSGADRTATASGTKPDWSTSLPADKLKLRWRVPVAGGYSGPTVADGRVYVTDRLVEPKQIERVHCFDWRDGKEIWSHVYDCPYVGVGYTDGPRASVTVDDGRAYALGTMGNFFCLDAASGKVLWQKEPGKDYDIEMPIWGIASAPLVEDDLVIVQIGGGMPA